MRLTLLLLFVVSALATELHPDKRALNALRASTVHLRTGTGFVVQAPSKKHYLITNWHVCKNVVMGEVVKFSPAKDLCAVLVSSKIPAIKVAKEVRVGQVATTRGYPKHVLTESIGIIETEFTWTHVFEPSVEDGGGCPYELESINSGNDFGYACLATYHSVYSSVYGQPGSSGSPVVDNNGDLIGVISSAIEGIFHETGLVKLVDIKEFLATL